MVEGALCFFGICSTVKYAYRGWSVTFSSVGIELSRVFVWIFFFELAGKIFLSIFAGDVCGVIFVRFLVGLYEM